MKNVLFVPGFGETIDNTRDYTATLQTIENQGYNTSFVPITWPYRTIKDWSRELEAVYNQYDPEETILSGFSFGAMTALDVAARKNPSELWLFSLSPYFAEDLPQAPTRWLSHIGKRREAAFRNLSFDQLAGQISCRTLVFMGEKEGQLFELTRKRADTATRAIMDVQFTCVPGCGHDVADPRYQQAIAETI